MGGGHLEAHVGGLFLADDSQLPPLVTGSLAVSGSGGPPSLTSGGPRGEQRHQQLSESWAWVSRQWRWKGIAGWGGELALSRVGAEPLLQACEIITSRGTKYLKGQLP